MSSFLLDTNVISELIKLKPEPKVTVWLDATHEELLFLSVLTLALNSTPAGIQSVPGMT